VTWIAVVGGVALLGFVGIAVTAVAVMHKAEDVMAEVAVVRGRLGELSTLIGQLELPPGSRE
jgi:hypothetical protein